MIFKQLLSSSFNVSQHLRYKVRLTKDIAAPTQLPSVRTSYVCHVRYVSSFDASKDDPSLPGTSIFNIKKTIKSSPYECTEGFTCIRTVCPVCNVVPGQLDPGSQATKKETIYVNKTTGNFTCSACQHLGRWDHIEKFFLPCSKSARTVQEMRKLRDAFLDGKKSEQKQSVDVPGGSVEVDEKLGEHISNILGLKVRNETNVRFRTFEWCLINVQNIVSQPLHRYTKKRLLSSRKFQHPA